MAGKVPRLKKITADAGYKVAFKKHIETNYQWKVRVMQKPESTKGFIPQKWRCPTFMLNLNHKNIIIKP